MIRRAVRTLLSAGRLACGAGEAAPAGARPRSGGVGRRQLLGLIAAAPVALPATVRAATAPQFLMLGMDVQRAGGMIGAAVLHDTRGDLVDLITRAGMTPRPSDVLSIAEAGRSQAEALGLWADAPPGAPHAPAPTWATPFSSTTSGGGP